MEILHRTLISAIKIGVSILVIVLIMKNALIDGMDPYYSTRDYTIQNESMGAIVGVTSGHQKTIQGFKAQGNILNKIYLYYQGEATEGDEFTLTLKTQEGVVVKSESYPYSDYAADTWLDIDFKTDRLNRGNEYFIQFDTGNSDIVLMLTDLSANTQGYYGVCMADDVQMDGFASIGFQFTYKYMTLGNALYFGVKFLLIALFALIFCYGIMNIESIYTSYTDNFKEKSIVYGFYFALYILFLFNPLDVLRTDVDTYTREMGAGLLTGYDVSKTISNFTRWFVLFGIFFIVYTLVANYFVMKEKTEEQSRVASFVDKLMVLGCVDLLFRALTYYMDEADSNNVFRYSSVLIAVMLVLSIAYIVLKMDRHVSIITYYQALISVFALALPVAAVMNTEWESGKLLIGIQTILAAVMVVLLCVFKKQLVKLEKVRFFDVLAIVSSIFPFYTSFYIEFINILNQYSVFVESPRRYYVVSCVIIILFGCVYGVLANIRKWQLGWWKLWSHVWLVIGVAAMYQQISLVNIYTPDIFESANYSVLINGFLQFGEIPIVEHLGLHMMDSVWEGLIYAVINQDFSGAIVSPYSGMLMIPRVVLFYFFVRKIWSEDIALWVTLLFPFYGNWFLFAWGMLICLAVVAFTEKNTYFRAAMLWLAVVWCAFNRADIGMSFGIACVITLIVYIVVNRNWKVIKTLLTPLIYGGGVFCIAWSVLCGIKDINPVTRLIEFFRICMAKINWTFNGVGDNTLTVYVAAYILVPLVSIICLIYIIFSQKFKESLDQSRWILLLMLGFAYFGNYTRTLTRHSIGEMSTRPVFWTAYVFLALFISCIIKKKASFVPIFTGFILLNALFTSNATYTEWPIANTALAKVGTYTESWRLERFASEKESRDTTRAETIWKTLAREERVEQRVIYSDEFKMTLQPYRYIMDTLLDEDDTFLDFIFNSYLYSEFDRKDPVYVAQSPVMLSGELTQEYFIDEIEKNIDNIPIALMPNESGYHASMDGINLNYKYYKVAEFIYSNYIPLCSYGDFSVWCLKDRYDEMLQRFSGKEVSNQLDIPDNSTVDITSIKMSAYNPGFSMIDWDYAPNLHSYFLNRLPLYWAELDEQNAADNDVLGEAIKDDNGAYVIDKTAVTDEENGNYLMLSTAYNGTDKQGFIDDDDEYIEATLIMGQYENGKFVEKCKYGFSLKEGRHNYLFRVSSDYYWMLDEVDTFRLECGGKINGTTMSVLQGD